MQHTLIKTPTRVSGAAQTEIRKLAFSRDEARGAVFTKPNVVELILDSVGYKSSAMLFEKSILEPCFGGGDFLIPMAGRLLESFFKKGFKASEALRLRKCIAAVELHKPTHEATSKRLLSMLVSKGVRPKHAEVLTRSWLKQGDFLFAGFNEPFDFIVGNPPYLRQEAIPPALLKEYRARFHTLYDRADLYILFFERALELLKDGGRLGYICSDRWMKNKYGGPLRKLISTSFHLERYINMFGYAAFHDEVSAYTAITVLSNRKPTATTQVCFQPGDDLNRIEYFDMDRFAIGDQPWLIEEGVPVSIVQKLEAKFPTLEESGCRVGIGVATGNDSIYIRKFADLPIEASRKMPLVMRSDLHDGSVVWSGNAVINVFEKDGGIVDLQKYPKLKKYFEAHLDQIKNRNVAKRNRVYWYRTIDRVDSALAVKPKLLIPDIGDRPHIVHEKGAYHPHHNLYFVVSDTWNLDALKAVLMSDIARMFINAYSVKMRGGYVRYQAQYLRKIRIPVWGALSTPLRDKLVSAGKSGDIDHCNRAAASAYGLSKDELSKIGK